MQDLIDKGCFQLRCEKAVEKICTPKCQQQCNPVCNGAATAFDPQTIHMTEPATIAATNADYFSTNMAMETDMESRPDSRPTAETKMPQNTIESVNGILDGLGLVGVLGPDFGSFLCDECNGYCKVGCRLENAEKLNKEGCKIVRLDTVQGDLAVPTAT